MGKLIQMYTGDGGSPSFQTIDEEEAAKNVLDLLVDTDYQTTPDSLKIMIETIVGLAKNGGVEAYHSEDPGNGVWLVTDLQGLENGPKHVINEEEFDNWEFITWDEQTQRYEITDMK